MQTFCVTVACVACGDVERIYVNPMDYVRWEVQGVHAQDAFPYLTIDERESLITSMCLNCIDEMYSDMGEGEEEEDWYPETDDDFAIDPESDLFEYASDYYVDEV